MFVKYKRLNKENSDIWGLDPIVATQGSACADLCIPEEVVILGRSYVTIDLLVGFDLPSDFCLYIQPRSSLFTKHGIISTTGIIDSDYHGSVHAQLFNMDEYDKTFERGSRLVQIQILPRHLIQLEPIQLLPDNHHAGLGSTGL